MYRLPPLRVWTQGRPSRQPKQATHAASNHSHETISLGHFIKVVFCGVRCCYTQKENVSTKKNKQGQKQQTSGGAFALPFDQICGSTSEIREQAFAETIRSIPRGKVATYGQVAAAAGYPRYHRQVARLLKVMVPGEYPWQRVVGAGGEIKVAGRGAAAEQRLRLKMEGVTFVGKRVDLSRCQHVFDSEE